MEKNLFANLKALIGHYRWRFAKAFLMVLLSNCLLILNPLVFRQAVMRLDVNGEKPEGFLDEILRWILGAHIQAIGAWGILLFAISLLSAYFKYRMRYDFISVSRDAERQLRSKLFEKIQKQSMSFFDHHGVGELLSRLTNDISAYRDVLGPGIMYPLFFLTLAVPGMLALFSISTKLALISLIPLLIIPILNSAVRQKIYDISYRVQKGLADLSNIVQEQYSGVRIIKSYVIESILSQRFKEFCRNLIHLNLRLANYQGLLFPFFALLTKLVTVILVLFSAVIILGGWGSLSTADFISFMWLQSYIFFPVLMFAWVLPIYERGRAAYDRLVEIYDEPIEVKEGTTSHLTIPALADIHFNHLSFHYPNSNDRILSDVNLLIKGGSLVGITGPVGSGKSTLFRLLNREYEIPKGMILINGRDIHDYPLESFSREVVSVEQAPFLFSRSVADNVKFGKEDASFEDLEMVSKFADLHDTILGFPEQYETMIGERGVTLSGGQKQRVAMARAFLVDRSILLFDDIFSAVDASTEKRIFQAIKTKFIKKTILFITHRVSILEEMDRVIYMKEGRVIEDGTPSELLKQQGSYAALVELQRLN